MTVARVLTLAAYDFSIVYRKGSSNGKPDALSRRPDYMPPAQSPHPILLDAALLPIPPLRAAAILLSPSDPLLPTIKEAQLADPALQAIATDLFQRPARESNLRPPSGKSSAN